MILTLLHNLSDLQILLLTVCAITAAAVIAPHVGRHILRLPENSARDDAAFDAFKAIMSMIGVVMAFSLVQANTNLHAVETTVGKEAAALISTDRILLRSGKPELVALRPLLAAYGNSLIHDEWPELRTGERSDEATEAYNQLSKSARAIAPDDTRQQAMYNELLKSLDDLSDLREAVVSDSDLHLPEFFWITTFCLLGLAFALALLTANSLNRTVGVGAAAAAVGLLLAFVIIVDLPFEGETSVTPRAIEKALLVNARRS
jgi:hypothetical protein